MSYEMLVLDLDGTLTNSDKKITPPTKAALMHIQEMGKKVVLASGRPTKGVMPLAKELELEKYGSYILSFNGGRIINCRGYQEIYNKLLPSAMIQPIYEIVKESNANVITYTDTKIISAFKPNQYTELESNINQMEIKEVDDFLKYVDFPINKLLITVDPKELLEMEKYIKSRFHKLINVYQSADYFLEIMPANIDKAYSLQKLLNSMGLTSNEMICCGDGHNDITMIEGAGLGVAMANAQPAVLESADYVTKSNDEDGILHVIEKFML